MIHRPAFLIMKRASWSLRSTLKHFGTATFIPILFAFFLTLNFVYATSAQDAVNADISVIAPTKKPNGNYWDSATGGIMVGRVRGILPDIMICVRSARTRQVCAPACKDSRECKRSLRIALNEPLIIDVYDVDITQHDPMYALRVDTPSKCTPCRVGDDMGNFPVRIDLHTVGCAGPGCSQHKADVQSAPKSQIPVPAFRGLNNCIGKDVYLPNGTMIARASSGGDALKPRLYEIAKWIAAIDDAQVQKSVLIKLRSRMNSADFDLLETIVLPDVRTSRVFDKGLIALLKHSVKISKPAIPESTIDFFKDRIVDYVKGEAVDRIINALVPRASGITAECALNEIVQSAYLEATLP
jgi:hypothetical protein